MKKLISINEVEEAYKAGCKEICIEDTTIITPSAKDVASEYGIAFVTECNKAAVQTNCCCEPTKDKVDSELIYTLLQSLMKEGKLDLVAGNLLADVPFISESDDYGNVKIVKGNTAKWEPLDTGNPNDKVFFNELIGAADNSSVNLGFMTIEECQFPWEVSCEEFFYVVEGTLNVVSGNKVLTAQCGDVLSFKKGAKLEFGSPNKVKVFYATH